MALVAVEMEVKAKAVEVKQVEEARGSWRPENGFQEVRGVWKIRADFC